MKRIAVATVLSSLALAGAHALAPAEAQACGGTFCDGGPQPMPVDQSGENILFVRDGEFIEAHIQIQYEGDAERFGWVIPMQSVPEFSVGSEPLFQALLAGSVPSYFAQNQFDDCSFGDDDGGGGDPNAGGDDGAGDGGESGGDGPPPLEVTIARVGALEIATLVGGTSDEVVDWLVANDYQTDDEAKPILDEYLAEGHVFGAVKLVSGADTNEIHPIVLRFRSDEPCIPLRLTRIAATDDMDVRAFFLGEARTVPKTYRHVEVNPLKIDWLNNADNYKEVISLAVDSPMADGRAFVTEYAGPSNVVDPSGLLNPQLDPSAFVGADAVDVIDILESQNAYFCDFDFGNGCGGAHPLMQGIVEQFLPVPEGVTPDEFYDCLSCYEEMIDQEAWNGQSFADTLALRIIEPGEHAQRILDNNPYLSRLYTTISPNEMMTDPMFHENPDLEDVIAAQVGTRRNLCNGDSVFTLPDGREVYLPAGTTDWPDFEKEPAWQQPWEEEVQEVMTEGAPIVLVTNTDPIDTALAAYNAAMGWPGGGGADGGGMDGADGADGGADGGGTGGMDGGADGGGADGMDADGSGGGCGCRTDNSPAGFGWALAFGAFGLVATRRRRR